MVTAILGIEIEVNLAWRGSLLYSMAGFELAFAKRGKADETRGTASRIGTLRGVA
jgi:hypothetical protein